MVQHEDEKTRADGQKQFARRCFNVIDSVKGGSGKTSLSLMLALAAQKYMQERERLSDWFPNYSLLMDMDMQGSALDYLLFGNDPTGRAPCALNDAILKYYTRETPCFISTPKFYFSGNVGGVSSSEEEATAGEGNQTEEYPLAVALASTNVDDRDRFRAVSRMNYSSQITYDAFGSGLKAVLKDANLNSYLPFPPQYVFFDMPPNSNGYSDCILELLLSPGKSNPSPDPLYPRNYFELMTLDKGHIGATMEWFQHFVNREQYLFPDHFFFVFSNIPPNISQMKFDKEQQQFEDEYMRTAIGNLWNILRNLNLTETTLSRIHFVGVSYQEEYMMRCCSVGTLASTPENGLNRSLLSPIKFLTDGDKIYLEDTKCTERLLEMMCTKD